MPTSDEQPRSYVRLTGPAVEDLRRLLSKDPQIVRTALKKMLLLQRDPEAGEPLLGSLIGWRKLVVGDNHWRIVWKVTTDDVGDVTLTISEVWAVGVRSDAEVYSEMAARVGEAGEGNTPAQLAEVIALLGRQVDRGELRAAPEPVEDPVPDWLRARLVHTAGVPSSEVDGLSGEDAMRRWEQYLAGPTK
jgi:mRNA interferase RelE/StbE